MSKIPRFFDYLEHIKQAATDACGFVDGQSKDEFLADKRTQQAILMSLIIIGEAATKLMESHPEFIQRHTEIPWRSMRNMRNRMAHGYFDVNLEVVWDTVNKWLPNLVKQLEDILKNPSVDHHQ